MECGEDEISALLREVREEAGAYLKNIKELGYINDRKLKRKTYCCLAETDGELEMPQFTEDD